MLGRIALVISSMLLTLLILELGARLMHGPEGAWKWQNLVLLERDPMAGPRRRPFVYHAQLGFISTTNFKSTDVNYDARGYGMGLPHPRAVLNKRPVLALGDSYTHGDEV